MRRCNCQVLDLPTYVHWPKLLLFAAFEACLAALIALDERDAAGGDMHTHI